MANGLSRWWVCGVISCAMVCTPSATAKNSAVNFFKSLAKGKSKGKPKKSPGKVARPTANPPNLSGVKIANYPDYDSWVKIWNAVDLLPPEKYRGRYLLPSGTVHMYSCASPPTATQKPSTVECYNDGPVSGIDPGLAGAVTTDARLAILQFLALRYGLIATPSNLTSSPDPTVVNGIAACVRMRLYLLLTRVLADTNARYAKSSNRISDSVTFSSLTEAMYVQRHLKLLDYAYPDAAVFGYFLQFTGVDSICTLGGFSRY